MSFTRRGFGEIPTLEDLGAEVAGEAAIVQGNLNDHAEDEGAHHDKYTNAEAIIWAIVFGG